MLLNIEKLRKEYKRGNKSFFAVDSACLSVEHHDFICITGRSGSGKSTFLNMVAGLLTPTSGTITLHGNDYSTMKDKEISILRNEDIGFIPQGQCLLPNLTVIDNVRLPFYLSNRNGDVHEKTMSLLKKVGIADLADMYPAQLSGGESRRVSIARALINSPSIVIADEPTSNLDKEAAKEIMKLFSDITSTGIAILLVTHDITINKIAYFDRKE